MTKFGMVMPSVARTIALRSCHRPRRSAEMMPAGMPTARASASAMEPTIRDTGKLPLMISLTVMPS